MQDSNADAFMRRAIELAQLGPYSENPRVGAVVVKDGVIVGEGFHQGAGTAHAEVVAIAAAGERCVNSTIYVSLEPCSHHGRTGPCTHAIIESGISRVVYSQSDPTDLASGGHHVLEQAGVDVSGGLCADESLVLNREWTHWVSTGKPYVTWKFAQSLDSRVSAEFGTQTVLSSTVAHESTHLLRSRVDAIVIGTNTAIVDDPALTARLPHGELRGRQPMRVVIGKRDLPVEAKLFNSSGGQVMQFKTHDIDQVLTELASIRVKHVLLEGGPKLARAFLSAGAVQEVVTVIAPVTFGSGPLALSGLLDQGFDLRNIRVTQAGVDLVISGTTAPR